MSETFYWANIEKQECLFPVDFGCGCRFGQSMHRETTPMSALYSLLSAEWKGDHILFLGDEGRMPFPQEHEVFQLINHQIQAYQPGYHYFDLMMETYWNRSALFKDATGARKEIECFFARINEEKDIFDDLFINEYRLNLDRPLEGLFLREGQNFRYIINHTKKVYYSFALTKILYSDDHSEADWVDPLCGFMAYGRTADTGPWIGDIIGVSNEIDESYSLLKEIYIDW